MHTILRNYGLNRFRRSQRNSGLYPLDIDVTNKLFYLNNDYSSFFAGFSAAFNRVISGPAAAFRVFLFAVFFALVFSANII